MKIVFELAPEEHAIAEKALRKAAREAGESLDGAVLAAKDALVYLCRRILETGGRCSNPHCRREVEGSGQCHHSGATRPGA